LTVVKFKFDRFSFYFYYFVVFSADGDLGESFISILSSVLKESSDEIYLYIYKSRF